MVIPPNNIGKSSTAGATTTQGSSGTAAPKTVAANPIKGPDKASTDNVSFSPEAQAMAQLEQAVNKHSGVDESKVAALREAIANGSYSVDSQSISQKMLSTDNQFS